MSLGPYPKFSCRAQWGRGRRGLPFLALSLSLSVMRAFHTSESMMLFWPTPSWRLYSMPERAQNKLGSVEKWRQIDKCLHTIFTTLTWIACSETSIHENIAFCFCTFNVVSWWMRATSKCHPSLWGSQLFSASRNTSSWESLPHYTSIIHWFSLTTRAGPPYAGNNLMTVQKLPGIMWQWLFMHIVNSIISTL